MFEKFGFWKKKNKRWKQNISHCDLQGLFASAAQTCTEDWRQFKKGPRIAQTLHPNFDPIQLKPKSWGDLKVTQPKSVREMTSNSTVRVSKGSKENGRWITEQSILFKITVLGFAF